jgi:hypothetical protein
MTLDEIKLKRLCEVKSIAPLLNKKKKRRRAIKTLKPGGQQVYDYIDDDEEVDPDAVVVENPEDEKNSSNQSGGTIEEGEKKHHTPKFVQHCVSAITEKPKTLARVEAGGSKGEKGSPFAICHASYKKKTRSKAAEHSKGSHHTVKQYEGALKKLREAVELARQGSVDRRSIIFGSVQEGLKSADRRHIRYSPEG